MAQQNNTCFGVLEPFDGGDFIDYSERLNAYFIANNIGQVAAEANEAAKQAADKRKVAVTISVMGKSTYSTLKYLCLPDLPAEKSYEEIITILKGFYKPKVLEVAETYRFHQAVQTESESVAQYANKLKRLAVHCNFGTYLTRALRDQFVGGVRSRSTRKKLLSEDRTFDQAVKVAQADELAEKESKELLLSAERTETVQAHSISNKKNYSFKGGDANKAKPFEQGKTCFRCGSTQHLADKCSHTYTTCNYCKKAGHLAKVCFKKKKADSNAKAHNIVATRTDESSDSDSEINSVNGTPVTIFMKNVNSVGQKSEISPQYKLGVNINGQEVSMEIDTGSSVTLLNSSDFERMGGNTNVLKPATVVLKGYTGNEIKCYGEDNVKVKVGEQVSDIKNSSG